MKILTILPFCLFAIIISCKQRQKHQDIFKDVPIADTQKFIDSIEYKTRLDAGPNFTARPSLNKNEYYHDERNFRDSFGNLREYSIIERWDTGDVFTNYFYYKNQLIDVSKRISTSHIYQMSNYYFRNDSFFCHYTEGRLALMQKDTLLIRGYQYLSIKGDVGDTSFRKYFGKKSYPPNSMISVIE
jgi:hypothetical protein